MSEISEGNRDTVRQWANITVTNIKSSDETNVLKADGSYMKEPFKCDFFIVLLCISGHLHYRLNLKDYELNGSDILVIFPGVICEFIDISDEYALKVVAATADDDNVFSLTHRMSGVDIFRSHAAMKASELEMTRLIQIFDWLDERLTDKTYTPKADAITGFVYMLAADLSNMGKMYKEEVATSTREMQIVEQFVRLVQEYCTIHRDLSFYSSRMCMSTKYLSQVVVKVCERRATSIIRDHVILEAKAMLCSRKYNVQEVSDMLHFANQSFFGTYFRKATGLSPLAYLLQMHRNG